MGSPKLPKIPNPLTATELKAAIEGQRRDDADQRQLRGKRAPPEGVCRAMYSRGTYVGVPTPAEACGGRVVALVRAPVQNLIGGGPTQAYVAYWHCEDCGLMYHTPPK